PRTGRLQDARADDAARSHQAELRREQVHAAAAAVGTAAFAAIEFGDDLQRRHPLRQRVAVAAVRAEDDVLTPQVRGHAHRHRLLADVSVARAVNEAALVRARELLFTFANEQYLPVELEQFIAFGND